MNDNKDKGKVKIIIALSIFIFLAIIGTIAFSLKIFSVMEENTKPNTPIEEVADVYIPSVGDKVPTMNEADNHLVENPPEVMEIVWDASTACTSEPVMTDIGSPLYPIDPKYGDLKFLGQIFTAYDCGMDRVNEIFGVMDGKFDIGSYIWLHDKPSSDLINTFEEIGYKCGEEVEDEDCIEWEIMDAIDVDELMKLEPYYENFKQDDCRHCG